MRRSLLATFLIFSWGTSAMSKTLSIEFNFTPFIGNHQKSDQVITVEGEAQVFLNNIPVASTAIQESSVSVLFAEREIAGAVWINGQFLGPGLRKGKNKLRIEFSPTNVNASYQTQFRWAEVTDQETKTSGPGNVTMTNLSGSGSEVKEAKGKVKIEREFIADYAEDLPWHHYTTITALSEVDRKAIFEVVRARYASFQPDFSEIYKELAGKQGLDLAGLKQSKALDKIHAAGVRMAQPEMDKLDFYVSGNPEVMVRPKNMGAFVPQMPESAQQKLGDDPAVMKAMPILFMLFPQFVLVAKTPEGFWKIVN